MADVILEFLTGSGLSALPVDFTLADLIPYIIRLWLSLGIFSAVWRGFASLFAALLDGLR